MKVKIVIPDVHQARPNMILGKVTYLGVVKLSQGDVGDPQMWFEQGCAAQVLKPLLISKDFSQNVGQFFTLFCVFRNFGWQKHKI